MASTNKTITLNLNQWIGSDKPARADFNTDNALIDNAFATRSIHPATCTYDSSAFTLTGLPDTLPDIFTARFTAPADFTAGDVFRIGANTYAAESPSGELAGGAFKEGAVVSLNVKNVEGDRRVFFGGGGGGGGGSDSDNTAALIANRVYPGVDLTEAFAAEIAAYANVWEWIKARIQAANFDGLNVGDYISWQATNGYNVKSEIAGIDTYYNYGDTPVPHHIDLISRDCYPEAFPFNKVNYNNGTTVSPSPWLASDLYARLNSLQMQAPNAATANPALVAVDYRTTGVYDKLPDALKAVIVSKRIMLPSRYTAGSLLTEDNSFAWTDAGKLWIPSEVEVCGADHWGTGNGFSGGFQQYPIFAQNMKRIKGAGDGGDRAYWWLLSANSGNSTYFTLISQYGHVGNTSATFASARVPICFRIA